MRVFILIAMLTAVGCDDGPPIQKGEGPITQKAEADRAPGLPVGADSNQQKVQPASSPQ